MVETSIVPDEARHFGDLAGDWWDPNGASAMLHKLNPVRLAYLRDRIDAAAELIDAAKVHAAAQGLDIEYRCAPVEALDGAFDLVTCLEVIEHVADPAAFVSALAARLAPGGLMILSTPNRTAWSKLLTITLAEGFGRIPKGTHDYDRFIAPEQMNTLLAAAGLQCVDFEGIAFSPSRGLHLSEDLRLNYLVAAVHAP